MPPPAGTLDQSVPYDSTDTRDTGWGSSAFQTYVAGITGNLGQVAFWAGLASGCATYNLDVYAGAGTGGTKLASLPAVQACNTSPGLFHVPLGVPIPQTAGQTYTLSFTATKTNESIASTSSNPYASGCSNVARVPLPRGLRALRRQLPDLGALAPAPEIRPMRTPRYLAAFALVSLLAVGCGGSGAGGSDGGTPVTEHCKSPSKVCSGTCVDVDTDNANCGTCGNACADGEVCAGGTCGTTCGPDLTRCTASDGTDHCKDTAHDPANCGSCGHACTAPDNATAACAGNRCAYFCADGFADCNTDATDGCETDVAGDPANCGACGHVCPAGPGEVATCASGTCGVACDATHADCNADPSDGCEVDISTDVGNCGACANACPSDATDTATCAGGHCGIQCLTGHGDCNNDPTDGCENTLDSPADCGACGASCPAVTNAAPTCTAPAQCGFACDPGYADCNTDPSDGCEVDTQTDVNNCGTCGNACPVGFAATGATCNGGTCAAVCNPGGAYIDCDGKASTGCEVDAWSDNANCGTCGNVCSGLTSCLQGTCSTFGALDQSVPPNPSSTTREGISATHFQTYVAGKTGHLGGVAFWGGLGGCGTFKLDVWAGAGVPSSGAPIYTGAAVKACGSTPGIFKVDRNAWVVPQTAGQTYTLRFTQGLRGPGRRLRQPVPERLQRRRPPVPGDRAHGPQLRDLGVLAAAPRRASGGRTWGRYVPTCLRTRATRGRAAIPRLLVRKRNVWPTWPAYAVAIPVSSST